jgi:hypothetical protein
MSEKGVEEGDVKKGSVNYEVSNAVFFEPQKLQFNVDIAKDGKLLDLSFYKSEGYSYDEILYIARFLANTMVSGSIKLNLQLDRLVRFRIEPDKVVEIW